MQSQWQSYSKYYNILDNCFNHSEAKKMQSESKKKGMIMKSKGKEINKMNIYNKRKAECLQNTAKGGDTMYLQHFELT